MSASWATYIGKEGVPAIESRLHQTPASGGSDAARGESDRPSVQVANDVVLSVQNLKVYFDTPEGVEKAVDDVIFELRRGDILAIVGESC